MHNMDLWILLQKHELAETDYKVATQSSCRTALVDHVLPQQRMLQMGRKAHTKWWWSGKKPERRPEPVGGPPGLRSNLFPAKLWGGVPIVFIYRFSMESSQSNLQKNLPISMCSISESFPKCNGSVFGFVCSTKMNNLVQIIAVIALKKAWLLYSLLL